MQNNKLNKRFILVLTLLIVSLVIYFPSLSGRLFYDDEYFIVRNEYVHNLSLMPKLFTSQAIEGAGQQGTFYRPLQFVAHSITYQFFNTSPFPYHLISLLFHFGCAVLLFYLLRDISFSATASFFASLLFLVHPVNSQAVSYVSGLGEPLGLFFMLLALLIYRKDDFFKNKFLQYSAFFLCVLLTLLSKERSAVFLFLFLIFDVCFPKENQQEKHRYVFYVVSAVLTVFYFIFRKVFVDYSAASFFPDKIYDSDIFVRLWSFLYAFWEYLVAIFFPKNLYSEHPFLVFLNPFDFRIIFSLLLIVSLLVLAVWKFRSRKVFAFSFFWFMLALTPSSGIIPVAYTMKEHWVYYSMVGICAGFAFYFFKMVKNRKLAVSLFIILCLLLSIRTFNRAGEWSDPKLFWKNELKNNPVSENAIANLAYEYYLDDDIDKSIGLYKFGIEVTKSNQLAMMYYNLGFMYALKGDIEAAVPLYKKSLEIDPYYMYALEQLSKYYKGRDDEQFNLYNSRLEEIKDRING